MAPKTEDLQPEDEMPAVDTPLQKLRLALENALLFGALLQALFGAAEQP